MEKRVIRAERKHLADLLEEILRKTGAEYVVLGKDRGCCGTPLLLVSDARKLSELVSRTSERIN
ncbi:MAG: hypothetical protein DRJ52_09100 [Thermoprotei archaeon]|nr:MAG: hypothetical protein DRJ52_09100 [Thermoprotei archaeon]RLE98043.1 MAG: hypothetical protein DRJ63_08290 [Thermoprotei archaeon]HDI75148.1 hypothetical protein [Thermoprotei archaeon]